MNGWCISWTGTLFGSVGHRVKIHKIAPVTGKEQGDLDRKAYVVLQNPKDLVL
jgi:hypothetical protein